MNIKCVKIEKLAECVNDEIERSKWTEYFSSAYKHPYLNDKSYTEWAADDDSKSTLMPSVGERGHWLNDDLTFVSDRMACSLKASGLDDKRCVCEFEDVVRSLERDGGQRMFTITAGDGSFCTFRATALERIPNLVPFVTPNTRREQDGLPDLYEEIPSYIYAILRNSIHEANGEPLEEVPLTCYEVKYCRTDVGSVMIGARTKEEAIEKARNSNGEIDGIWLQSDPDHTQDDWEFYVD